MSEIDPTLHQTFAQYLKATGQCAEYARETLKKLGFKEVAR